MLFEHQRHLDREHLVRYADELGLDRFTTELNDEVYRQRVLEHLESGQRSGVRGTPGLLRERPLSASTCGSEIAIPP